MPETNMIAIEVGQLFKPYIVVRVPLGSTLRTVGEKIGLKHDPITKYRIASNVGGLKPILKDGVLIDYQLTALLTSVTFVPGHGKWVNDV